MVLIGSKPIKCEYEGCDKLATDIAFGREKYSWEKDEKKLFHPFLIHCCPRHAEKVADENSPEYHVDCPNCGCIFGVN